MKWIVQTPKSVAPMELTDNSEITFYKDNTPTELFVLLLDGCIA